MFTTAEIIRGFQTYKMVAEVTVNHKGTELITFSEHAGLRKILTGTTYGLKNMKVVDLGIGKYGLNNSIITGARVTFYFNAAVRTIDFILSDEHSLSQLIGGLAADAIKIGIASAITKGLGDAVLVGTAVVSIQLLIVVGVGFAAGIALNILDNKYHLTDKLIALFERGAQEIVTAARSHTPDAIVDLAAMYEHKLLEHEVQAMKSELDQYLVPSLDGIMPRTL